MKIKVNFNELNATAHQLKSNLAGYENKYNEILSIVNHMDHAWQGSDSQEYVNRFNGLREDFYLMKMVLTQYLKCINECSHTYSKAQKKMVDRAIQLAK